jgi:hypothetical protein
MHTRHKTLYYYDDDEEEEDALLPPAPTDPGKIALAWC